MNPLPRLIGRLALVSCAAVALSSCGGNAPPTFAANFDGTWSGSADVVSATGLVTRPGAITLIFASGVVTGSDTAAFQSVTSSDAGVITSAGVLTDTATGPTGSTATIQVTLKQLDQDLVGTGTITVNNTTNPIKLVLTQP